MEGNLTMSRKEVDRVGVMQQVAERRILQQEAAARLGISVRQVKRLLARLRGEGPEGLVSRRRGRRPNNAFPQDLRQEIVALVRSHYADFGPTLAAEKLTERHGHVLSVETLRQWMQAEGLWQVRARRVAAIHPRRPRRHCRGELVQIDGSPHDWLENRGPRCTLIVFIDDATGALLGLRLAPSESTQAYMETLREVLQQHGRPVALYSDRHSIFRVNHPDHEGEITQFTRALQTLDIQPIHARTPQAKGRVERANQTLQDRLVKELRLQGINDLESANAWLPHFIEDFNRRYGVAPANPTEAFRPVLHSPQEIHQILCLQHLRTLSKNLSFQFHNRLYQLRGYGRGYRLRGARITVCEAFDGTLTLLHQGKVLDYSILQEGARPIPLDDEKSVHLTVDQARILQAQHPQWKPAPDHPWRRYPSSTSSQEPSP